VKRRGPRAIGGAIGSLADRLAPATPLAEVQRAWAAAVGPTIAAQAEPTGERDGVLTVTCASAVWAQELDLMSAELVGRINGAIGVEVVRALRCQAVAPKVWTRPD
jgi:predicted nucleic acid-binding Zn ribbon protein